MERKAQRQIEFVMLKAEKLARRYRFDRRKR